MLLTAATAAMAYKGQNGEWLAKELELTDAQSQQVQTIMQEKRTKMKEVRKEIKALSKEKMAPIRAETHDRLSQVLNKEQLEKFEAMKQERKKDRKHKMKGHGGHGGYGSDRGDDV
ncbi:MAG: hypothetical protein HKN31_10580 [Pricia sp.]|nr:hypothetical protein [Pricia sp.]